MKKVLVVAPHPDDETLGCGGSILRHISKGDQVFWMIMTEASESMGYTKEKMAERDMEIAEVGKFYSFSETIRMGYAATTLDGVDKTKLINEIAVVLKRVQPEIVYLPHRGDAHSDHLVTFDAIAACSKWFRFPSIKTVYSYETISETDFSLKITEPFVPNVYVNIATQLEKKLEVMRKYKSELKEFPFPRSEKSIRALATIRGATSGFEAAEAFMLLKERVE